MKKNKNHIIFAIVMAIIVLVIGGLIYQQEMIIRQGEITIFETRPVDPRDLLRGEYVILRYAIESDKKILEAVDGLEEGTKVFIELEENEQGIASVKEVFKEKPENIEGLFIIGEVDWRGVRFPDLEQFYVPEGSGRAIERAGNDLHVEISLKDGKSRVVKLLDKSLEEIDPSDYIK